MAGVARPDQQSPAANTNIYTSPNFSIAVGSSVNYQFRYVINGKTAYDAFGGVSGQNRTLVVPNVASTNIPTVYWDDASPNDVLIQDTPVTFSVNMTARWVRTRLCSIRAVTSFSSMVILPAGWLGIPLPCPLINWPTTPVGSGIYTLTETFPAGSIRSVTYKYSINGADDEAGFAQNHFRYIRSTGGAPYNMPVDTFGTQYVEPKVGGLAIGSPLGRIDSGYLAALSERPSANQHRCMATWQDVPEDHGRQFQDMTMGNAAQFFRLIQPTP